MNVLIVDDHGEIRRLLRQYIEATISNELVVRECGSAEEAISIYPQFKPDFVLMDIELGAMSGFDATIHLMKIDSEAKVVIVSSHNSPLYKKRAKELQVQGYICKDNLRELVPILHMLITKYQLR